jgi:redox-sensing transcriptional repressor
VKNVAATSKQAYQRIASYYDWLAKLDIHSAANISATTIARALGINDVVVRKDLSVVSGNGKPKTGYDSAALLRELEKFLGYDNRTEAALCGVGHIGVALLNYHKFEDYGLKIVVSFDSSPGIIGSEVGGIKVVGAEKITSLCRRMHIPIGIITVPEAFAQEVCDAYIAGGVKAIWNFAPIKLSVPQNIAVRNENMAASLAILFSEISSNSCNSSNSETKENKKEV